jgi:hypothetical protein
MTGSSQPTRITQHDRPERLRRRAKELERRAGETRDPEKALELARRMRARATLIELGDDPASDAGREYELAEAEVQDVGVWGA